MQNMKELVKRFLPTWDGRLGIDHVTYNWNGNVHRDIPYINTSNIPAVIAQKVALYKAAGFDMIRMTWQGPWANASQFDALCMAAECEKQGMQFALLLDPGGMRKFEQGVPQTAITNNVIQALTDTTTVAKILESSAYLPEKIIYDFNTGANIGALVAKFGHLLAFSMQNVNFGWPVIPASPLEQVARNAAALAIQKFQNAQASMTDPCLCAHFNDSGQPLPVNIQSMAAFKAAGGNRNFNQGVWSLFGLGDNISVLARILSSFGGLFLQQQLAITPATAPRIWFATADDYDEGTAIEPQLNENAGLIWAM